MCAGTRLLYNCTSLCRSSTTFFHRIPTTHITTFYQSPWGCQIFWEAMFYFKTLASILVCVYICVCACMWICVKACVCVCACLCVRVHLWWGGVMRAPNECVSWGFVKVIYRFSVVSSGFGLNTLCALIKKKGVISVNKLEIIINDQTCSAHSSIHYLHSVVMEPGPELIQALQVQRHRIHSKQRDPVEEIHSVVKTNNITATT